MATRKPIALTGNVYCDWNAFSFVSPAPDRLCAGDLIIWSWSGDSSRPKSKSTDGLFRVSVFDGKRRRLLKVKHTRAHALLRFTSEREREERLSALVRVLRELRGRVAELAERGYEVAPLPAAAPADSDEGGSRQEPKPTGEPRSASSPASADDNPARKPVQGTLF